MRRKFDTLNVVTMFSTLTAEHWETIMRKAVSSGNVNKLIAWRYGLQAGLADAASKGFNSDALDIWVIKRCRDIEKCVKVIISKRHPKPKIDAKKDPAEYKAKITLAKKQRDRELEHFFQESNF